MELPNETKRQIFRYVITQRVLINSILFVDTVTFLSLFVAFLYAQIRIVSMMIFAISFATSLAIWYTIELIDRKVMTLLGVKNSDSYDKYNVAIQQLVPHKIFILFGRKKEL